MTEWHTSQQAVLDLALSKHGPTLVFGGPGSGKTLLNVESALRFLKAGNDARRLLVLSPTRASAGALRDRIESGWAAAEPEAALSDQPSRSFAAYAFWLLGEARRRKFLRFSARSPRLLSGAEQDRIIGEILADFAQRSSGHLWPDSLSKAATTEGFRKEVRELIERAAEYGIPPEQMHRSAAEQNRPEWSAAADVYARYRQILVSDSYADAFDPAGLIDAACRVLEAHPALLEAERQRLQLVLVDDLQDAGSNVYRLLRLVGAGKQVLAFANPDISVQGFRGARPDKLRHWAAPVPRRASGEEFPNPDADTQLTTAEGSQRVQRSRLGSMAPDQYGGLPGLPPTTVTLPTNFRSHTGIGEVYARVVERIGSVGPAQLRQRRPIAEEQRTDDGDPAAEAVTATSVHIAEQAVIAEILSRYDQHRVPFNQIAVITRSSTAAYDLARQLRASNIPTRQEISELVLSQEPAVSALLDIVSFITAAPAAETPAHSTQAEAELELINDLMVGRYGDTDPLTQRSLRQLLRRTERQQAAGDQDLRSADELLRTVLHQDNDPVIAAASRQFPGVTYGLGRIGRMVAAVRTVHAEEAGSAGPEDLLWAAWEASGVSQRWAAATAGTGWEAQRADRDLDAVLALFHAAERFTDQSPRGTGADFVAHMRRIELPMDTIAASAAPEDSVEVLTPATAAGREFNTVILYGLQEGSWPNLRPRGALLGTPELIDLIEHGASPEQQNPLVKRFNVLQDEYRLFAAAVSRASQRLYAVAVESAEEQPSMLLELITPAHQRSSADQLEPEPATASRLVAELRRFLESSHGEPGVEQQRIQASQALAELARHGIAGARPEDWWGIAGLSDARAITGPEETLSVYPSAVGTALENPLAWFTSAAGGVEAADFSRMLGTLIHQIADELPQETDLRLLTQALADRWDQLRLDPGWQAEAEWHRAVDMLRQLVQYYTQDASTRELLGTEVKASARVKLHTSRGEQEVHIRGTIDRVERTVEGRLHVVDLKTGRRATPVAQMPRHAQLGLYQLLLAEADLPTELKAPIDRALLIFVAANNNYTSRIQRPVPLDMPEAWPRQQLQESVEIMTAKTFEARHEGHQDSRSRAGCRIGPLCPLCTDTRQVTQP